MIKQPSHATCTVRQYARHDYEIPISWLTPAYIKVNTTSTQPGTALLTTCSTETFCYRHSRWTEHLFRQNLPFLTLLSSIRGQENHAIHDRHGHYICICCVYSHHDAHDDLLLFATHWKRLELCCPRVLSTFASVRSLSRHHQPISRLVHSCLANSRGSKVEPPFGQEDWSPHHLHDRHAVRRPLFWIPSEPC